MNNKPNNRNRRSHSGQKRRSPGGRQQNNHRRDAQVRNNCKQQIDKYTNLAQEARKEGDYHQVEYYYQHVDHYQRLLNEIEEANPPKEKRQHDHNGRQKGDQSDNNGADQNVNDDNGSVDQNNEGSGPSNDADNADNADNADDAKTDDVIKVIDPADMPQPSLDLGADDEPAPKPRKRIARGPGRPRKPRAPKAAETEDASPVVANETE